MKRYTRFLSALLACCMMMGLFPTTALATDAESDIAYAVTGGNIYFDATTGTITDCDESVTEVIIPERINNITVTTIGYEAFKNSLISNIKIPNNITAIHTFAFSHCENLTHVEIPESVNAINAGTFYECTSLTDIIIPEGVQTIGQSAFVGCIFSHITLPRTVTYVDPMAFISCKNLDEIDIDIANQFYHSENGILFNKDQTTIVRYPSNKLGEHYSVPIGTKEISPYAFFQCNYLESIAVADGVEKIGDSAFRGSRMLTSVTIPNSVTEIGSLVFTDCNFNHMSIPGSVQIVGGLPFDGTQNLISAGPAGGNYDIELGWTKKLPDNAIAGSSAVLVVVPQGISSIGEYAFNRCFDMTDIYIPRSVTSIGEMAFGDCIGLKNIYYEGSESEWNAISGKTLWGNSKIQSITKYYNSIMPEITPEESDDADSIAGTVKFFSSWDANTRQAFFNNQSLVYTVSDLVDTSSIEQLVGKYVLVETDETNIFEVTSIKPVESKVGLVQDIIAGNGNLSEVSLQFDDDTYVVSDNLTIDNSLIGETLLYHLYSKKLVGFEILIEKIGRFERWDSDTQQAIIDEIVYPTNYMSDLSFQNSIDEYIQKNIYFMTSSSSEYCPLFQINGIYNGNDNTVDSDVYIVERVREYVDDGLYAQWDAILNSDDSWETKYQQWTELFTKYGFLDVKEGVTYLSNVLPERRAYLSLTNNEMYSCYLTWDWLNNTKAGRAAKVLLIADGLAFNNELSTWLDPFTWVGIKDTPGVAKYKDMLYDFMSAQSLEIQVTEYISLIKDTVKTTTSAGNLYAESLIDDLNNCKSEQELQMILTSNKAESVIADLTLTYKEGSDVPERKFSLSETSGYGKFSKTIDGVAKTLTAYNIAVNDILNLIQFDGKLAVYTQYKDLLNEIAYAPELPWTMRLAAVDILSEIDDGIWGRIKDIAIDVIDLTDVTGILTEKTLTTLLSETGYASFSEILLIVDITSWAINKIVDIGSLVKGAAYVEGYAYLSMHYRNKLIDSKVSFMLNQSPENAWDFFENYSILYQLRAKGEQAVLKMYQIDGISKYFTDFNYSYRESVIQDVLNALEQCRFLLTPEFEIPESVQYVSKAVISCPVDVEVYAPDGTLITALKDDIESDIINEHGRFSVVYRPYTGSYAKIICIKQTGNYQFKIVGLDNGLVNFEMAAQADSSIKNMNFSNIPIAKGTIFDIHTDQAINEQIYGIDVEGDGTIDKYGEIRDYPYNTYIPVSDISLNQTNVTLDKGQSILLSISILPDNATRQNTIWVSRNPDIASVIGGKVVGKSVGTTHITCISQDNTNLISVCEVTVREPAYTLPSIPPTNTENGPVSNIIDIPSSIPNGSITVHPTRASRGEIITITATPNSGYKLAELIVTDRSGNEIELADKGNDMFTFTMPASHVDIHAAFAAVEPVVIPLPFTDISADAYYYDAVRWAVDNDITNGTSATSFGPDESCTRAQVITFLWRAAGCPAPVSTDMVFTDVSTDSYYYDAVLWAIGNNITKGTDTFTFSPNETVTRGQIVTFLWRAAGCPEPTTITVPFIDVPVSAYYFDAVLWAVENNITTGISATAFAPERNCIRAETVTFLYRAC